MPPAPPQGTTPYCPVQYQLVPEIYVTSLPASLSFYTSLGFHTDWVVPDIFAQVSWPDDNGSGCILFLKVKPKTPSHNHNLVVDDKSVAAPAAGNIRIMVPDVDAQYAAYRDNLGLEITQELGDRKFVLRDFIVRDPDGFEVRFGSWLRGPGEGLGQQHEGPRAEGVLRSVDGAL